MARGRIRLGGSGQQHMLYPFQQALTSCYHIRDQHSLRQVMLQSYTVQGLPLQIRPLFVVACFISLLLLALLGFHPTLANKLSPRQIPWWDKVLHFIGFLVSTTLFYGIWLVQHQARRTGGIGWRYFNEIVSTIVCGGVGSIGSEFVQSLLPYKTFQWGDVVANLLGTTLGIYVARRITLNARRAAELRRLYQPVTNNESLTTPRDSSLTFNDDFDLDGVEDSDEDETNDGERQGYSVDQLERIEQGVEQRLRSSQLSNKLEANPWDAEDDSIFELGGDEDPNDDPSRRV
ncbi:hypothetical protein OIO90_003648 [Microbotryomycetes sp. JL221]|nr:hypothetical protein OIO90_003648 [Microbotryomycetes sp. JL221]